MCLLKASVMPHCMAATPSVFGMFPNPSGRTCTLLCVQVARIATAEEPAGGRIDVQDVALRLVDEGAAAFGVGSDLDVGVPSLAAVAVAPAIAATGRLKRHYRAVFRGEDSAPAAGLLPELLHGNKERLSQKLFQAGRDGITDASGVSL